MELIGIYLVACALLVVAGAAKAVRPDDSARALDTLIPIGVRRMRVVVRTGAVAELALGGVALVLPTPATASLVALSYCAFAVVVACARRRGGAIASCGCFGTPDTPATRLHVVVNTALAASASVVAVTVPTTGSMASILADQPGHGLPLLLAAAVCAWLTLLSVSALARLEGARRLAAASGPPT